MDWLNTMELDLIPGKFIYDEIDIEAYKKKKGQRVSWSPYEDSLVMNPSFLLDEINISVWELIHEFSWIFYPQCFYFDN